MKFDDEFIKIFSKLYGEVHAYLEESREKEEEPIQLVPTPMDEPSEDEASIQPSPMDESREAEEASNQSVTSPMQNSFLQREEEALSQPVPPPIDETSEDEAPIQPSPMDETREAEEAPNQSVTSQIQDPPIPPPMKDAIFDQQTVPVNSIEERKLPLICDCGKVYIKLVHFFDKHVSSCEVAAAKRARSHNESDSTPPDSKRAKNDDVK